MKVTAVVVTFNRKELLIECLEALARQTHPLDRVVLVDNASTDGTLQTVEASGIAERLPLDYLRITRNGGGAEGFHYAVRAGLDSGADWIWLMDDDCRPEPDALERLLASEKATAPGTAVLAPPRAVHLVGRPGMGQPPARSRPRVARSGQPDRAR